MIIIICNLNEIGFQKGNVSGECKNWALGSLKLNKIEVYKRTEPVQVINEGNRSSNLQESKVEKTMGKGKYDANRGSSRHRNKFGM